MPLTKKSGRRHSIKGKRTRAKRNSSKAKRRTHHRRKRSHKKKRSAHRKRRRHTRSMRGRHGSMRGGSASASANTPALVPSPWIPSDLTNIYRTSVSGVTDTSNALNGLEADPSPLPYKGQLVGDGNMVGEILRMA